MKKILLLSTLAVGLAQSALAQLNEAAVAGANNNVIISAIEGTSVRWSVTGTAGDMIAIGFPNSTGISYQNFTHLGLAKPGFLMGSVRQLVVERVDRLADGRIRVLLRHDPVRIQVSTSGLVWRTDQGELIGLFAVLRTSTGAIIDSDPVVASQSVIN